MLRYKADYYDGFSPISVRGDATFEKNGLSFDADDGSISLKFSYNDIVRLDPVDSRTRIELKGDSKECANRMIVYEGTGANSFIRNYILSGSIGPFRKLPFFFQAAVLWKKFMIIAAAAGFSAAIIFGILNYAYLLLPVYVDIKVGESISESVNQSLPVMKNNKMDKFFSRLLKRLVPSNSIYNYSVILINEDEPNAFALPNGNILVFKGIIDRSSSPEELAAVLAHEISHVENRHGIKKIIREIGLSYLIKILSGGVSDTMGQLSGLLVFMKYSRDMEREADLGALKILNNAHISGKGLIIFLKKIPADDINEDVSDYFSTHPSTRTRMEYLEKSVKSEKVRVKPILLKKEKWSVVKKIAVKNS